MTSKAATALAWATPVRPDKLGESLEAYAKAVPTIHALRLCHRFGKGSNVHVTSLPAEIELAIEALVIKAVKAQIDDKWDYFSPTWSSAFEHFESRCAPMDHLPDSYSPLSDEVSSQDLDFCKTCEEDHYFVTENCENLCKEGAKELCWTCTQKIDDRNCMKTCCAQMHLEMNYLALEWDYELDDEDCEGWRKMIDVNGNFGKYAKILRRHFGVDVRFIETRMAKEDLESWPRHLKHRHHRREELKTTYCYLTLMTHPLTNKTYETSDTEMECGGPAYTAGQAVALPKTILSGLPEGDAVKFRRALNVLGLEPYLHPSQIGAKQVAHTLGSTTGMSIAQGLQYSSQDWPQLTLIVESEFNCDHY